MNLIKVMIYIIPIFYIFILAAIIIEHDQDNGRYRVNRSVLYTVPFIIVPFLNIVVAVYYFYIANKLDKEEDERNSN